MLLARGPESMVSVSLGCEGMDAAVAGVSSGGMGITPCSVDVVVTVEGADVAVAGESGAVAAGGIGMAVDGGCVGPAVEGASASEGETFLCPWRLVYLFHCSFSYFCCCCCKSSSHCSCDHCCCCCCPGPVEFQWSEAEVW